jgi:hypothetical protein
MKAMDFLTLLGELDETAAAPVVEQKKHRPLWVAAAAGLCACLLGFSAWFFLPPMTVFNDALITVVIRVDDRLISYEILDQDTMSRFERMRLPDELGEVLVRHKDRTFYRVAGGSDLFYLIMVDGEGKTSVLEYEDYVPTVGMDMTDSLLTENGWFTEEDIAALNVTTPPTMGEVWKTVYGVSSADGLQSIRFEKLHAYEGGVESRVRVKAVMVRDPETLARLYRMLASMIPADYDQKLNLGTVGAYDEAYLNGKAPLCAQTARDLTVTLESGRRVTFSYYPATGLLLQGGTRFYTMLSEADNEWLIDLAEIDMNWKDWGTEKDYEYGGEGCETATTPTIPEHEAP